MSTRLPLTIYLYLPVSLLRLMCSSFWEFYNNFWRLRSPNYAFSDILLLYCWWLVLVFLKVLQPVVPCPVIPV